MTTPPTDYKKLAEDTLAGYIEMNAVALMGALSISYSHDEAVSIVASYIRTPKLARAVLALDAENQRLRMALKRVHTEALLLYPNEFPDIPAYQQIILDTIDEALESH